MYKIDRLVCFAWLVALITACSTGYQRSDFLSYGFSEKQLSENVWRVTFEGNSSTTVNEAYDKATLRAADLAISHGYRYFIINDTQASNRVSTLSLKKGDTSAFNYPTSTISVSMYKEKPEVASAVYDAKFVCQKLGSEYGVICSKAAN